jgi:hypothetical protein
MAFPAGLPLTDASLECVQRDKRNGCRFRFGNWAFDLIPDPDGFDNAAKLGVPQIHSDHRLFRAKTAKVHVIIVQPHNFTLPQSRV